MWNRGPEAPDRHEAADATCCGFPYVAAAVMARCFATYYNSSALCLVFILARRLEVIYYYKITRNSCGIDNLPP